MSTDGRSWTSLASSGAAAAVSTSSSSAGQTKSIAILIGSSSSGGDKKGSHTNNLNATTVPLVVWTLQERGVVAQQSSSSSDDDNNNNWKYDLKYYEFLDDTARWTHLDQLLLQLCDTMGNGGGDVGVVAEDNDVYESSSSSFSSNLPSIHLGTSDNLEKIWKNKQKNQKNSTNAAAMAATEKDDAMASMSQQSQAAAAAAGAALTRTQKLVHSLQTFLDNRLFQNGSSNNSCATHIHLSVPVDPQKVNDSLSKLLVNTEDAQLAVRGNVQLSQPLIRQGLALWLQAEGLYQNSMSASSLNIVVEGSIKLFAGVLSSYLVMDSTAAQAIHLLPPANDAVATVVGGNLHTNSLWGLLSKPCLTSMGKRLLHEWLRQPLVDLPQIQQRQDAVTRLLGMSKDSIREGLSCFSGNGLGNLARLGPALAKYHAAAEADGVDAQGDSGRPATPNRIVDTKKPLETLYHLFILASHHLPHLLDCMDCIKDNNSNSDAADTSSPILLDFYSQVEQLVAELERSVGLAEAVLDLDRAPQEFLVKPEYAEELSDFHQELEAVQKAVDDEHQAIQEAWDDIQTNKNRSTQVRLERVEDNTAWQFRLPDTNDSKLVESLGQKIKTHRILKNGVYFSSMELRQLSSKYQDLHVEYNRLSRKIVQDAMAIASTYASVVDRAAQVIGALDVFCALAYTAAMSPNGYCRPTMTDSDDDGAGIILKEARHPCLELQEGLEFIPNDVHLLFPNAQLLVSGPNMGGKSVYIRSLGAIVCMAQIGSYVPCTAATINICHSILARVGAGDLQERGISTFMAEMLESSAILRAATRRSLIIIDELGRGTSTFDGYGLARAITEYLRDCNCHVTAQKGSQGLTFLYQIRSGPCLESFGIQVAEMANMPKLVIDDAKKRARELENFDIDGGRTRKRHNLSKDKMILLRLADLDLPSLSNDEQRAKLKEIMTM